MSNYVVCIISYKRAETQLTYNTLIKCNYKNPIYIFVSDNDTDLETYKLLYDNVIVYNKVDIYLQSNIDLYDNFKMLDNCTIARNAVLNWARNNNYENVIILDDDIKSFRYRFEFNNKLISKTVDNIEAVFNYYIDFLNSDNKIKCISFAYPGIFIGGLNGKFKNNYQRLVSQVFIMKSDINFKATRNEDEILSNNIDYITITPYLITQDSEDRASNNGGLHDDYENNNLYIYSFYSILHNPASSKINIKTNTCSINWNYAVPKIVSGRFKK